MTRGKTSKKKGSRPIADGVAEMEKTLEKVAREVLPTIHDAITEVGEDYANLLGSFGRLREGQEATRSSVTQAVERLREDLSGALLFYARKESCGELGPLLNVLDRMLTEADFSDGETMRDHVGSLALTLKSIMGRMGMERIPIEEGKDLFDSELHECVRTCNPHDSPMPEVQSRTIVRVEEYGYTVNGRVAFPAKVWVQKLEEVRASIDGDP